MKITPQLSGTLLKQIESAEHVFLQTHDYPDGDALGSTLGFYYFLKTLNKSVSLCFSKINIESWAFLPFGTSLLNEPCPDSLAKNCVLIVLDCSNPERMQTQKHLISGAGTVINIDHHGDNSGFGTINYVDADAASTGQIIYNLFTLWNKPFNREIAYCLLLSIVTDTGRFLHSNTSSEVFLIASMLMTYLYPGDYADMARNLYAEVSPRKMALSMEAYSNIRYVTPRVVLSFITTDSEGEDYLIDGIMQIKGVDAGILLRKVGTITKISFRAKAENINVRDFAKQFGGGGHVHAAGATLLDVDFDACRETVYEKALEYFKNL